MAGEENTDKSANQNAPSGNQGSGVKKIAGKFNSVEEAVEQGYGGLERAYHETREELGAIKVLLERSLTPIGRGRNIDDEDQGYRRGRQQEEEDDNFDAADFMVQPQKYLRKRDSNLSAKMKREILEANANMVNNATQVLRFQMKNPDLDEHEDLVESFFRKTNPRDPLQTRLKEAGKSARAYLAKLKGSNEDDNANGGNRRAGRSPDNEEFVENSADGNRGNPRSRQPENTEDDNEPKLNAKDEELSKEIQEQKAWKSKRFAAPQRGQ